MTFTDDDLKRLKDAVENNEWHIIKVPSKAFMEALLARLEAAEHICKWVAQDFAIDYQEEIEAWRKAAGK